MIVPRISFNLALVDIVEHVVEFPIILVFLREELVQGFKPFLPFSLLIDTKKEKIIQFRLSQ